MDVSAVLSAIGSVGFPIVMCVMLFQYMKDESSQTREAIMELKSAITTLTERLKRED